MVGIFYQRGVAILTCVLSVMTVFLLLTKPFMLSLGFSEKIVYYSYQYTLFRIPGIWLYGMYDATKNYINA